MCNVLNDRYVGREGTERWGVVHCNCAAEINLYCIQDASGVNELPSLL